MAGSGNAASAVSTSRWFASRQRIAVWPADGRCAERVVARVIAAWRCANGSCAMCFMNHHPPRPATAISARKPKKILRIRARCAFHCASLASRWYGMRIPAITELVRIYGGFRAPDCCFFTDGTKTLAEVRESSRTSVGKARAKADSRSGKSAQKTQGIHQAAASRHRNTGTCWICRGDRQLRWSANIHVSQPSGFRFIGVGNGRPQNGRCQAPVRQNPTESTFPPFVLHEI